MKTGVGGFLISPRSPHSQGPEPPNCVWAPPDLGCLLWVVRLSLGLGATSTPAPPEEAGAAPGGGRGEELQPPGALVGS